MNGTIKNRVRQLYSFLKEANQLRFRPVRLLADQLKVVRLAEMPRHPSMQLYRPVQVEGAQEVPDTLLRIKRPPITRCPTPPESIASWLMPSWDDPAKVATYAESRNEIDEAGETVTVRFDDDEQRASDFVVWDDQRSSWAEPEQIARGALRFFEMFYDIHSTIEKDGEQIELMVGDGHLSWRTESSVDGQVVISHPILLKRVELRFNAKVPEFTVHETDRVPELYGAVFVDLEDIAPAAIKNRKDELESSTYHPLGWEDTEAFLKAFIQTVSPLNGEFLDAPAKASASTQPTIWRDPVLFLRKRVAGIANAVDAIVDDIEQREVFPSALAQITGTMREWDSVGIGDGPDCGAVGEQQPKPAISSDDILLAKEANAEQLQIIHRLHASGSVIVQGPPGTGKTHTIGNVVGHLLSQGKSILVTAQTAKALRVLRDKVPEVLQPLCVSVLGSDQNARRQLESSIGAITERLTSDTAATLLEKAKEFETQRKDLLGHCKELKHKLREALENEYKEIIVGGQRFSPSEAARFVAAHREQHAWIPSPVRLGASICLTEHDLARLYELGMAFSAVEERDARYPLLDLENLPSEGQFRSMVSDYQHLLTCDLTFGSERWLACGSNSAAIAVLADSLKNEFSDDIRRQAWRPYAIVAGIHGGTEREVWERLIGTIENAADASSKYTLVLHHRPQLSEAIPIHRQRELTVEIYGYLAAGGKLGFIQLAARSEWRQFIKTVSVTAGQPNHPEHFDAIRKLAELEAYRLELEPIWDNLIGQHITTPFSALGSAPELSCRALIREIRRCLEWYTAVWAPLADKLKSEGLDLDRVLISVPHEASQISEYLWIDRVATEVLPQLIAAEATRRKLKECEAAFSHISSISTQVDPTSADKGCIGRIVAAVLARDAEAYSAAHAYARRLHAIKPLVTERDSLVNKLKLVAPGWAAKVFHRASPHDKSQTPGDVALAWTWRQLHDTLVDRDRLDAHELQREIDTARDRLREITQWLIDSKAWGKQLERLQGNYDVRQALVGWLDAAKRLTSTRQESRRQALLSESRKLMKKCTAAVPVWIMPISIVAENFDPRTSRFDVVIIDEASQADLNALIPLYMGKQIVVVGDHEQVTPLGVGKDMTILENLRKSMLKDIPNSFLFDNQSSIYDIARQSFGDAIRLVEHFRCVPEIIAFSNQLSYEGKILPLRESNSTSIKPACVPYKVDGVRDGDVNQREAEEIVALIKAMTQHDAYEGKTIGVISMLKENQAALIQSLLHKEINSEQIEKRRIQAGISAEFQGDERDIIFLSMVDSPSEEGPLRVTGEGAFELIKKRYNVAASRARDQLWVVHSFDPDLHLKSADLRYRLLQHARDPQVALRKFNQEAQRTESPFEREVLKRLTSAGYFVRTQWQVGHFRIDMVVEGAGKRLAVECDGDRFHPLEKLAEDMERQSILERLGWQFVRIRGSAFYRDSELAMQPVFSKLNELEIPPDGSSAELPSTDITLVHQLEELIARAAEVDELSVAQPIGEVAALHPDDDESSDQNGHTAHELDGFAAPRINFDNGCKISSKEPT